MKPTPPRFAALFIGIALYGSSLGASNAVHHGDVLPFVAPTKRIAYVGIPDGPDEQGRPRLPEITWEAAEPVTVHHAPATPALWMFVYYIEGEWVQSNLVLGVDGTPMKTPNPDAGLVALRGFLPFNPEPQPGFLALYEQVFGHSLIVPRGRA